MAIIVGILIFGLTLVGAAIYLAILGTDGITRIHYFGVDFSSTSVALTGMAVGAVFVYGALKLLLKTLRELAALPS